MSVGKRIVGGLVAGGIAEFAGTSAMEDKTTRGEDGAIVESGGLGAYVIRVGDCVQLPDGNETQVTSVEGVPCETAHDAQVFAEFDLTGSGGFPGQASVDNLAFEGCATRWEAALGPFDTASNLDLTYFTPTSESWAGDDREVSCFVVTADGAPLTGSKLLP